MFNNGRKILVLPALLAIGLFGCGDEAQVSAPELSATGSVGVFDTAARPGDTIVEIAVGLATSDTPEFTILVAALQAADLVDALNGKGQYTVFAPTDAAFQKLFDNPSFPLSPAELLADKELLTSVLLYHVAPGRRMSEDVLESDKIRTLSKDFLYPMINGSGAFIVDGSSITSDAQLLAPSLIDISASNGVIHVIDEVLLP
jgi:uncharacterized surface protein with fasciclin (FAS1) repeats